MSQAGRAPKGRIVLHLPGAMGAPDGSRLPGFLSKLHAGFSAAGAQVEIRQRDRAALEALAETPDFHIVWQGRYQHPRLLNTAIAYVFPFWYLDPQGVYGASTVTGARFDPDAQDPAEARAFADRLRKRLVEPRQSRLPQPEVTAPLPRGAIAVFLQGQSEPTERLGYMPEDEMLRAVLADTQGRPVIIKPHPLTRDLETFERIAALRDDPRVTISLGNIHDILAASAVTVSLCSAVSLEGMLHHRPAVLFGRSDFHHCTETVTRAEDWPAALSRALARDWPFDAFLHWFLGEKMLNAGRPDLLQRAARRIGATGADLTDLGLAGLAAGA
ncbi:hypothetical protein [Pseudothioclava arenosa]|uniref:Capsule polysaccharide biosynthesis protein n=1 Tax=Pseudothioclava arenosa TaxID=1795308 RepID=A0A2A4CSB2_9RHOB|nr:hypothetical protein [Pseudothioclava arenosa]PCD77039.1 hypothetical protein CLN94_04480 [Pseudothioclava arenosa]